MSQKDLHLRLASPDDADLLLAWRNDPVTRQASHSTAEVTADEHAAWLQRALENPKRQIFMAMEGDEAVAMVRADQDDGVYELSWSVAPSQRGRGLGKRAVRLLADRLEGPLRAEVKEGNVASQRIAESVAMRLERQQDGVLYFVSVADAAADAVPDAVVDAI